jgi:hypothetical protein
LGDAQKQVILNRLCYGEKKCPLWLGDNHKKGIKGGGNQFSNAYALPVLIEPAFQPANKKICGHRSRVCYLKLFFKTAIRTEVDGGEHAIRPRFFFHTAGYGPISELTS